METVIVTDIFQYAELELQMFRNFMRDMAGYKSFTTFYADLTLAEVLGPDAVRDTFERVCREWIGNYKYFTEFEMCLNIKSQEHYAKNDMEMSGLYVELQDKAVDLIYEKWADDEEKMDYFYKTTD